MVLIFPMDGPLKAERAASERHGLDVQQLSEWYAGGAALLAARRRIAAAVAADPDFPPFEDVFAMSKAQRYARAADRYRTLRGKMRSGAVFDPPYGVSGREELMLLHELALGPEGHTALIHHAMFIPTIERQASAAQRAAWLPAARAEAVLGCYAQTEMAHGSDVKGLETTATYDGGTDGFVLHTPTLGATKWWPAALGRTATHAIVHARLLVRGVDHGVKPFLTQLRDLATHRNLPGVQSGDIGPTLGVVAWEEGWCRFDRVRLPAEALLARYGRMVGGEYEPAAPSHSKRGYATMLLIRARMVQASSRYLGRAATIAVRYCAVRRQFRARGSAAETQVLDYGQVQRRVLRWVAATYALRFAGDMAHSMHSDMEREVEATGSTASEGLVHAIGSAIKAVSTTMAVDGIEELRRACGGHGFSSFAGLETIYGVAMVNFTGEGESYMLILQAAKAILREYVAVEAGGPPPSPPFGFVRSRSALAADRFPVRGVDDMAAVLRAFEHRAGSLIATAAATAAPGHEPDQWSCVRAAWAFGELLVVSGFVRGLGAIPPGAAEVSGRMCALFALDLMERNLGEFMVDGYLPPTEAATVGPAVARLAKELRPCAVGLVDALGCTDGELVSALGRADGRVYETLLQWAQREPLNAEPVVAGWERHYGAVLTDGGRAAGDAAASPLSPAHARLHLRPGRARRQGAPTGARGAGPLAGGRHSRAACQAVARGVIGLGIPAAALRASRLLRSEPPEKASRARQRWRRRRRPSERCVANRSQQEAVEAKGCLRLNGSVF